MRKRFNKDVSMYLVYDDEDNTPTCYIKCQQDKMCKDLGLSMKRISEYISRGFKLQSKSLYKLTNDDELIRLI